MAIDYNHIDEIVSAEYDCRHLDQEVRRRRYKTSQRIFLQCPDCGANVRSIPKSELDGEDIPSIPAYDEDAARLHKQRRQARRKELIEDWKSKEKHEWHLRYTEYLSSPEWRERRERVYRRERLLQGLDTPLCQGCYLKAGEICHHTVYTHVFEERTHEIVLLCPPCHRDYHHIEDPF